ncbi:MAG: hypothetical protein KAJ97_04175 [Acidobacteria bacterium]|nr:hypothetical protein [Acidobacteriota bacterium]
MNRQAVFVFVATTIAALLFPSPAHAAGGWNWSITPYIWASDISEDLILHGEVVGGGDTEFKDLLEVVDTSLQLHFEGIRDRWGLFADLTYIDLSDSETGELEILRFDVEITETLFEAGALYRPGGQSGKLDLLFGARLLTVDEVYRLQLGELDPIESSIDESYVDALIGARYHIPLSQRWVISLRGDLSLGGTDLMWTAQGMVGWRFGAKRNSAVFLGYRYRDMKYSKADFEVEKTLSGPGLGVKIGF